MQLTPLPHDRYLPKPGRSAAPNFIAIAGFWSLHLPEVRDVVGTISMRNIGHILFGAGISGLGLISIIYGVFPWGWEPVPKWFPWRIEIAIFSGLILLLGGLATFNRRFGKFGAAVLGVFTLIWALFIHIPRVASAPLTEAMWLSLGETSVVSIGAWVLFAEHKGDFPGCLVVFENTRLICIARVWLAIALPMIGLSHFVYAKQSLALVPAWLPEPTAWVYLGGAGHIGTGVAILFRICPRLAMTLEATMMSLFGVLVWVPAVIASPVQHFDWAALCATAVLAGSGWLMAATYNGDSWTSISLPYSSHRQIAKAN